MAGSLPTPATRNDFRIVQIWLKVAKYFAFTPYILLSDPREHSKLPSTIYPLVLFLFYLGVTMFSFYERVSKIYNEINVSPIVLDTLHGLTESIFIELVVIWSVLKRNKWRKLLKSIMHVEQKMNLNMNIEGGVNKDCNWGFLIVKIFLYHLVYVAAHVHDIVTNWTDVSYSLAYVIFRITTYYIMFTTLLVTFLCTWLKNRYVLLECFLKECARGTTFKLVFLDKEPRCISYDKLREFSQNYRNLFSIVQEINELLGFQMFFIPICTVLEILNDVNYGVFMQDSDVINDNTIVNIIFPTLYAICNVRIVMACDSVEKCGRKIRTTCLILRETSDKYEVKEELSRMANYVHGLCPNFSAAGFWQVTPQVLSTLFASVLTYMIIIIQFNLTPQLPSDHCNLTERENLTIIN